MRTISTLLCILLCAIFSNGVEAQSEIQRVRIDFENPEGFTRHLLLGFVADNSATDGFDYGYDALNPDDLPDDLNWIIEEDRYVIQGVGAFSTDKYYPLGMFLSNSGDISISLANLENFEETVNVYLYDLQLDTYTLLNQENYTNNLAAETYLDRFFLTFSVSVGAIISNSVLSTSENKISDVNVWHSNLNNELYIKGIPTKANSISIAVHSIDGKQIIEEKISNGTNENEIKLNTAGLSRGIYIIKIDSASFSHTSKVCIVN
ncbi:T9SS type A sorting domain-containing protein [Winogradskyella sp. R77965]|uniref:T9SS type A sorting domain-containing protein n=1 Tax=Winogradskyella sp. R77965 TaxID=3093872 RepID=UPI0037DBF242